MAHHVRVSVDDSHDPLNRMRPHQIAVSLIEDAFEDATKLKAEGSEAGAWSGITKDRRNRLEEIRRLLLAIIPESAARQ